MVKEEVLKEITDLVKEWKDKPGNLIMILHALEKHYGYVPREASLQLSKMLDVPLARIYEVITFYNFFKLTPPGKHRIALCMGTACYLRGAEVILDEIKNILGIKEGQTTKDGLFYLDVVRCLGCCGLAPVVMIDDKVYGKVKKNEIADILAKYIKEE
jgi:NADH-quinone oxidoreductase subunit E